MLIMIMPKPTTPLVLRVFVGGADHVIRLLISLRFLKKTK